MNQQGYKNLVQLSSRAYTEGFYHRPRVDHDMLNRYREGVICLSGCIASEVAHRILNTDSP